METTGMERIYYLADSILRLVYVNVLFILFTLLGLVVFGFFPALTATFYIVRKWLTGNSDIPITKNFWWFYKKELIRSNGMGWLLTLAGFLLYINLTIAEVINHPIIQLSYYPILSVMIFFLCFCLYVFPIYVQGHMSILRTMRTAFTSLLYSPLKTIIMAAAVLITFIILNYIPGLIPICGISTLALIITMGQGGDRLFVPRERRIKE
ncbi:YesL family protein [Gracilibacillus boraciitolerans]|uniref:YesL family protein n=1 Tax=Gracilibacillus boraciitolerans TaxID=307521 RepID=UPI0004B7DA4F|nr:DUF624 domain-containing protein [Gracilibacillus boraciitolerans]